MESIKEQLLRQIPSQNKWSALSTRTPSDADTDSHIHSYSAAEMGDNAEFFKGKRILVTGVGSGECDAWVRAHKRLPFLLTLFSFLIFDRLF